MILSNRTHLHTSLHCISGSEEGRVHVAEVVDLSGEDLTLFLLRHVSHIEVTWTHNMRHHHPLGHWEYNEHELDF